MGVRHTTCDKRPLQYMRWVSVTRHVMGVCCARHAIGVRHASCDGCPSRVRQWVFDTRHVMDVRPSTSCPPPSHVTAVNDKNITASNMSQKLNLT